MKKLFLLSFILALVAIGCKKDNTLNSNLSGSWEFRGAACYCTPATDPNAAKPGNGNILTFAGNGYKRYVKNALQKSGTYTISVITSGGETRNRISFSSDTAYIPPNVKIEGAKMTFYGDVPAAADGLELYYEKIK
ncbi:hypothetical protein [Mucilaginibacter dorajii]|uniref:Lipocalin-like domain-containing protein n=1 Tax=Mucilaginibacter dorajii TaxID=692994 RepID=A0ABP7PTM9_9SPHI|nr:hypothetical protein [Mucilaginibacter dorajii]MCS3735104.1 hypothetical protein [Mucilaginibacter dorajii]